MYLGWQVNQKLIEWLKPELKKTGLQGQKFRPKAVFSNFESCWKLQNLAETTFSCNSCFSITIPVALIVDPQVFKAKSC